jgi:hypothetical protein
MMPDQEKFLPEKMSIPPLPATWTPEDSVGRIKELTSIVKPKVKTIVLEFWIAHEMIVLKKVAGWTWGRFCKEAGYAHTTPYDWFKKYGLAITKTSKGGLIVNPIEDNQVKKHTNPDTKIQLEEVAQKLEAGEVTDNDAKALGDALAGAIKAKTLAPRVGAGIATAVKKSLKGNHKKEPTPINNFERLSKHALSFQEGLQFWADGTIVPESKDETVAATVVRHVSLSIITNYARLGIDVENIYETFYKGDNKDEKPKIPRRGGVHDITPNQSIG